MSIISRTGYTGEDGFEVYAAAKGRAALGRFAETGYYGSEVGILARRLGGPKYSAA